MPIEIVGLLRSTVAITWEDEHRTVYPARELRLRCRCAHCIEEMTGKPLLDPASVPADIRPVSLSLVGAYGLKVSWSDGHATGIYTFQHLLSVCHCEACRGSRATGRGK